MVTNVTVGRILNNANNEAGHDFSKINATSRDNTVDISDVTQPASGVSKRMFTRYRYWENGLTGKYSAIDGTAGSASEGTYNDETEPENAIMSYVEGQLNSARTWKSYNDNLGNTSSEAEFFTKLTTYSSPIKIIDPSNVNTSDYTDITKAHPFLEIYLQVPTISTRQTVDSKNANQSGNTNGTDNIGFFNPVMRQSLGDVEGMKYVIRGWGGDKWETLTIEAGGNANNKNILYYLNNPGFTLCYGVTNIQDGYRLSFKYPPVISFIRYTGETFSDGIISQGDTLPAVEVSNLKDLFINTTENTIHRLDINGETKEWVMLAGSGGGSFMPVGEELSVSGDIYYNQGNVGIGNNNPQYKLDITGALKANGLNVTNFIVNEDGKMGVGTTDPQHILHVNGDSVFDGEVTSDGLSVKYKYFNKSIWNENETQKLLASDGQSNSNIVVNNENHFFGESVAISGNYAIVGARGDDKGSAYIFERDSNDNWTFKERFIATDDGADNNFGYSVAISGNYAIVGAPYDDIPNDINLQSTGGAYIFERNSDGTWNQKPKLLADVPSTNDKFGHSVATSGNYAIIGAVGGNNSTGSAYIFERNKRWRLGTKNRINS